jgi:uncharacterized repeat protein (TIGR03803 family)
MKTSRTAAGVALFSALIIATSMDLSASSQAINVVHTFTGGGGDGANSSSGLMQAADGNFYGTTYHGGTFDQGTVFKMTASGAVTILYSFTNGVDGGSPFGALIQANDMNFYGTTFRGGSAGLGTVFMIPPGGGSVTILHSFVGGADGAKPLAGLLQAGDGNLYGTTQFGGPTDRGTLFGMTLNGNVFFRYAFTGGFDGAYPYAPVIQATDGSFYGTTYAGDFPGLGRIFRLAGGTVSIVHTFIGADGANPQSPLLQATDGNFYGTTSAGGAANAGTAFKMTPGGTLTVLNSFSGGADGANPSAGLMQAVDGNFYGTTHNGAAGHGTVFKMAPGGSTTVLHAFTGGVGADGGEPSAPLIQTRGGRLIYGTTNFGGVAGFGVVFHLPTTTPGDFGGLGKSDTTVFRPSTGIWYVLQPSTGNQSFFQWGLSGDIPVAGDYDGDGRADAAVFRPSTGIWYVLQSSTGTGAFYQWGLNGDIPVPGDYDGDGKTDVAVFRPSTGIWYVLQSSTGTGAFYQWGLNGDIPVPGDYDGDGKTDVAVFRPSTGIWYVLRSSTGTGAFYQWGLNGDVPVPGDYDGDGKTDVAVFRASTGIWYVLQSSTATGAFFQWGLSTDVPVPGDYDGDGKTDVAVFRPSTGIWYVLQSSTGMGAFYQWGLNGDIPLLKAP